MAHYYDAAAERFDDVYRGSDAFASAPWKDLCQELSEIDRFAEDHLRGSLLDAGCGTGHWSVVAGARAERFILWDCSTEMLTRARMAIEAKTPLLPVRSINHDLLSSTHGIWQGLGHVDWAILGFVLSHYTDAEALRILRNVNSATPGRLFFVDSISSHLNPKSRQPDFCKCLQSDTGWVGVRKRFLSRKDWAHTFYLAGWHINREIATQHFFAASLERMA